jgi:hypothetical protein
MKMGAKLEDMRTGSGGRVIHYDDNKPQTPRNVNNSLQILCFWTLSIVLPLSKTPFYLFFKTQCFGDRIQFQSFNNHPHKETW